MCWMCEDPSRTFGDYVEQVLVPTIDRRGWAVQAVGADGRHAPFAYTVGLTAHGLAELVVTGRSPREAAAELNGWAHYVLEEQVLLPGETACSCGTGFHAVVVAVDRPTERLHVAASLYGETLRALQLVWHDDRGRWPWQVGFRGTQPLLGERSETPT